MTRYEGLARHTATINGREVAYSELPYLPPPSALTSRYVVRAPTSRERTFEQLADGLGLDEESASWVLCGLNFDQCPDFVEIARGARLIVPSADAIAEFLQGDASAL